MIVTLTANPSIDRTMELSAPLRRGAVLRAHRVIDQPGGKGVNVTRAIAAAGVPTLAVLPADDSDLFIHAMHQVDLAPFNVPVGASVRVNITVTEPDGTTTKINAPGTTLTATSINQLELALIENSAPGDWIVLAGSLPPGIDAAWYARLTDMLSTAGRKVAVDTSGEPLRALVSGGRLPQLIKPNAEELASLTGADPIAIEADPMLAICDAQDLVSRGIDAILLTLGAAGAVLVTAAGVWRATPPSIIVRSTVGAGDCSLAGYLLAQTSGADPANRLRMAVAYGSAAASLPGTTIPTTADLQLDAVTVEQLFPARDNAAQQ